jgi:hypothetical protein
MPNKSVNVIFKPRVNVGNVLERLRDLITTPVVSEKYGYSIRINESRLLPEEITRIGMFCRQKLKKAVITLSVDEKYAEYVLAEIRKNYALMLDAGSDTVWETLKGESDFGRAGSLCHGWSSVPIYFYHKLGIAR